MPSFPAQPNLSTLQTNIIGDLNRGDTSLSDIVLIDIQSAISEYEPQRFYFNEALLTITLSNTNTYALSLWAATSGGLINDVIEVDSFSVQVSGTRDYTLTQKSYAELDDMDQGSPTVTGYPQYFAYWAQSLRIYPKVSSGLSLTGTLSAHVRFADLTQPADSNVWTQDGADLIRCAALKRLWGRRFRDYDAAQAMQMMEDKAYQTLQRRTDALAGSRIRASL